jgi:hypothetical protein
VTALNGHPRSGGAVFPLSLVCAGVAYLCWQVEVSAFAAFLVS